MCLTLLFPPSPFPLVFPLSLTSGAPKSPHNAVFAFLLDRDITYITTRRHRSRNKRARLYSSGRCCSTPNTLLLCSSLHPVQHFFLALLLLADFYAVPGAIATAIAQPWLVCPVPSRCITSLPSLLPQSFPKTRSSHPLYPCTQKFFAC